MNVSSGDGFAIILILSADIDLTFTENPSVLQHYFILHREYLKFNIKSASVLMHQMHLDLII